MMKKVSGMKQKARFVIHAILMQMRGQTEFQEMVSADIATDKMKSDNKIKVINN
jgi:O-acetyl-ADP-ribose deacetylase (regulator of RNase III)